MSVFASVSADSITTGRLRRTMLWLAAPVLAEQLLNSLVGMFDIYLSGRIGTAATNAVGLSSFVSWFASMLFALVASGTTALVARRVGARRFDDANRVVNQSLLLGAAAGIAVTLLMYFLAPYFALGQNMTGASGRMVVDYLRKDLIGYTPMSVTLTACAALRGAGDMRTPMTIYAVINIVNMIVSPLMVFGWGPAPELGVMGVVFGTVTARIIGVVLIVFVLIRGRAGLRVRRDYLKPDRESLKSVLRIGAPAAGDGAVMRAGQFFFLMIITRLAPGEVGEAFLAAHMIAVRMESLTYLPAFAWATAAATMVGQALGAQDPERAKRVGHEGVLQCGLLTLGIGAFFYFGAGAIFRLMHTDPLVHEAGIEPFRALAPLQPLLAISIIYVGALRGAGETRAPFFITLIGAGLVRVPVGYGFGLVGQGGLTGAWMGMGADMLWRALAGYALYTLGRWVHVKV